MIENKLEQCKGEAGFYMYREGIKTAILIVAVGCSNDNNTTRIFRILSGEGDHWRRIGRRTDHDRFILPGEVRTELMTALNYIPSSTCSYLLQKEVNAADRNVHAGCLGGTRL